MSRNFPSFIDAFVKYAESSGAPQQYLFWSAVSAVSAALERKVWLVLGKNTCIYPNQYIMLVGGSGTRKSTTGRLINEIIAEVPSITKLPNQLTAPALVQAMKDAGDSKEFEYKYKKYKNSSLFAFSSEAATMLKNNEQLQELLTDFYDCGETNAWSGDAYWSKKTVGGGETKIYNPCLNLLGCSTPKWLNEIVGEKSIKGGFIPRFLLINSQERAVARGWGGDQDEDEIEESLKLKAKLVEDLNIISKIQGRYRVAKGWSETYNEIEKTVTDQINMNDEKQPFYNRKIATCLKLSQVFAADESDELILMPEHLKKAFNLVSEIEGNVYDSIPLAVNKSYNAAQHMWGILKTRASWKKSEILGACLSKFEPAEIDKNLIALCSLGRMKFQPNPSGFASYVVVDTSPL